MSMWRVRSACRDAIVAVLVCHGIWNGLAFALHCTCIVFAYGCVSVVFADHSCLVWSKAESWTSNVREACVAGCGYCTLPVAKGHGPNGELCVSV